MRKIKSFLALLLVFAMTATLCPAYAAAADSDEAGISLPAPATNKELKDNGDGTYTLALSVTGATDTSSEDVIPPKANVVVVIDVSGSMDERATGSSNTRLYETKSAAKSLVDQLLANNKDKEGWRDIMEISIIQFANKNSTYQGRTYNNTKVIKSKSTNASELKTAIDGLTASGGTNWEAALQLAKTEADTIHTNGETTSIIFLTDGKPTFYGNDNGTGSDSSNNNVHNSWNASNDDARAIVEAGYKLYNIFAFGSDDGSGYLSALTNYAYTGKGTYEDTDEQTYSDGTKTGDYFYDATDTDALAKAFAAIIDKINSSIAYTNVELKDEVTALTSANVSSEVAGSISNCKYYRSGGSYDSSANDGLGEEWAEAPEASFDENGKLDWDLGSLRLENGVTYTITFVVWPSQESLDLVADLNNGLISYDKLTPDQKASVVGSGPYTLKTNTDYPTVTYSTVTSVTKDGQTTEVTSDPVTSNIVNPDPVGLLCDKITVEKKWEDSLDPSQREEVGDKVVLDLYKGSEKYVEGIELSDANNWKLEDYISVAPGIMITHDSPAYKDGLTEVTYNGTTYYILEEGHDYKFQEEDINYHYELTAYEYHPMIIGHEVKTVTFEYDDNGNITGIADVADMSTISATNTLKGGINLEKKVVDAQGNAVDTNDTFDITMNMKNPDGSAYSYDYRIYYGEKNPAYATSGEQHRSDHIYGSGTAELTLYVGDIVRFVNVNAGTLYYVEEDATGGYTLESIDYQIGGAAYADEDKVQLDDGNLYYTVKGNTACAVTVTNTQPEAFYVYHSSDNTVERILMTDPRVVNGKFNIVDETKKGYIYGGYYKTYELPAMTDAEILAAAYTEKSGTTDYTYASAGNGGFWMTDSEGTAYEGDQTSWDKADAYTEKGSSFAPAVNTVYYLKEVPNAYLYPAVYVVYDERDKDSDGNMKVKKLYQVTATDDDNYQSVGFNVNTYKGIKSNEANGAYAADSAFMNAINVTKNGKAYDTITTSKIVSGHTGYVAFRDVTSKYIVEDGYYREIPYHVTPDNVKVNAVKQMVVYVRNTRFNKSWKKPAMTKSLLGSSASYN